MVFEKHERVEMNGGWHEFGGEDQGYQKENYGQQASEMSRKENEEVQGINQELNEMIAQGKKFLEVKNFPEAKRIYVTLQGFLSRYYKTIGVDRTIDMGVKVNRMLTKIEHELVAPVVN